jgi:hypothetical protein
MKTVRKIIYGSMLTVLAFTSHLEAKYRPNQMPQENTMQPPMMMNDQGMGYSARARRGASNAWAYTKGKASALKSAVARHKGKIIAGATTAAVLVHFGYKVYLVLNERRGANQAYDMREIFNEILKHYKGDAAKASEMFRRACNWAADYSMQVRGKVSSWFSRPSWLGGSKPMMNETQKYKGVYGYVGYPNAIKPPMSTTKPQQHSAPKEKLSRDLEYI